MVQPFSQTRQSLKQAAAVNRALRAKDFKNSLPARDHIHFLPAASSHAPIGRFTQKRAGLRRPLGSRIRWNARQLPPRSISCFD